MIIIWKSNQTSLKTKLRLFNTNMKSTLLYILLRDIRKNKGDNSENPDLPIYLLVNIIEDTLAKTYL